VEEHRESVKTRKLAVGRRDKEKGASCALKPNFLVDEFPFVRQFQALAPLDSVWFLKRPIAPNPDFFDHVRSNTDVGIRI